MQYNTMTLLRTSSAIDKFKWNNGMKFSGILCKIFPIVIFAKAKLFRITTKSP